MTYLKSGVGQRGTAWNGAIPKEEAMFPDMEVAYSVTAGGDGRHGDGPLLYQRILGVGDKEYQIDVIDWVSLLT